MNVDAWINENIRTEFSGIVMIVQDGKITHKQVHKPAAQQYTLKINSTFYISSVTKTMTALAIAQLAERNLLSFGDPLSRYLKNVPDDKSQITIHQLLTHSSGLGDHYAAEGISDINDAVLRHLNAHNPRVLLIDTDSQSHATLVNTGRKDFGTDDSLHTVLMADGAPIPLPTDSGDDPCR